MPASLSFFPVDNGDMTLAEFHDGTKLVIDVNIRLDADDPSCDECPDVAGDLRRRLKKDEKGRPYVDAFLLSHPDQDHCRGFVRHFHVGPLSEYADDKKPFEEKRIVIREIWSSPMVFRRACKTHTLCEDAKAFDREARRRVKVNREKNFQVEHGDRILILGEDQDGKSDDLKPILIKVDETISSIAGKATKAFSALLIGPLPFSNDVKEEEELGKNDSSVGINVRMFADSGDSTGSRFLTAGDAEVGIWEKQWKRRSKTPDQLTYDIMQTPHHCSWHTLSWDSWSELGEDAKVSKDARSALAQAEMGAFIVATSKAIEDDDDDPPCVRAKREYESILQPKKGVFMCTGEFPSKSNTATMTFTVTRDGIQPPTKTEASAKAAAGLGAAATPLPHG